MPRLIRVRYSVKNNNQIGIFENLVDSVHLTKEILNKLNIRLHTLYNLLKFIRHNMDVLSLDINENNLVDKLFNIYHNKYLSNCKLSYILYYIYINCSCLKSRYHYNKQRWSINIIIYQSQTKDEGVIFLETEKNN